MLSTGRNVWNFVSQSEWSGAQEFIRTEDEENALTQKSESVEGVNNSMQHHSCLNKNTCSLAKKYGLPDQQREMKERNRRAWLTDRIDRLQGRGKYAKRVRLPSPCPPRLTVVLSEDCVVDLIDART